MINLNYSISSQQELANQTDQMKSRFAQSGVKSFTFTLQTSSGNLQPRPAFFSGQFDWGGRGEPKHKTMSGDIKTASEKFAAAAERAGQSWVLLRHNKFNQRLLIRHVRDLRRCERIRLRIKMLVEVTTL